MGCVHSSPAEDSHSAWHALPRSRKQTTEWADKPVRREEQHHRHTARHSPPDSVKGQSSRPPLRPIQARTSGHPSTPSVNRGAGRPSAHEASARSSSAGSFTSQQRALHTNVSGVGSGLGGSETDSDWDRYTSNDEEEFDERAIERRQARMVQGTVPAGRQREQSLFGLTDKRVVTPLKETTSLKLAKLRGCTFVNQYVVIKYLGRGACGRVFLCMDMYDNRLYAVKIVKKVELEAARAAGGRQGGRRKRNPIEDLKREVAIMRKLRHKNITALQEVVDDPSGNKMLLVMEYMEGGPVMTREALERGRCIPEALALQYFRDMCKALDYLHYNKVVHGDLKPENVLMSSRGNVTLSDFGCSKVIMSGNEYLERCNGTPAFLAPEMMRPHSRYRGRPTDVYAMGACLYTFVFGRIPFNAPNVFKLFQVVQHEPLRFPETPVVSSDLKDLLLKMLCKDPKQRLTMQRVMKHAWVTKRGVWPLRTVRETLRAGDAIGADDDEPDMPDFMSTLNVLDIPRADHLMEVIHSGLNERTYNDGEFLIRQGEQSTHLFYLLEGNVEVVIKLPPQRDVSQSSRQGSRGDNNADILGDDLPPALLAGASAARTFTKSLMRAPREYLVAVRGQGQFVGEMSSFATAALRCASVRAKGRVRAKIIPGEGLAECVHRIPEARQQVKEMVWMKQSENMVLEAMVHLSAVHDALEDMLMSSHQHNPSAHQHASHSNHNHDHAHADRNADRGAYSSSANQPPTWSRVSSGSAELGPPAPLPPRASRDMSSRDR
ncbi:hypothetical protein WJX73_010144 [Symbiochloris irregularis]|uniref:cGMP-dependent protein kinase n=1 Tax=Symbiochloris irregularis TaxID=706552 RepID=A0AAW1P208_9CHLO